MIIITVSRTLLKLFALEEKNTQDIIFDPKQEAIFATELTPVIEGLNLLKT